MGEFEIVIGFIVCAVLMIIGSGWKTAAVQILFIIAMLGIYTFTQYIWPEYGKVIFLVFLTFVSIIGIFFKNKLVHLLKHLK